MGRINKTYTTEFAQKMLSDIQNGVFNEQEAVFLRRLLMEKVEEYYSSGIHRFGMGVFQSEKRFINHVCNAMNNLHLDYTDLNIFIAAGAVGSVMQRKYMGMVGLSTVPDVSQYSTAAGAAHLMNEIVSFYNGE